jgi:hypothetical protein
MASGILVVKETRNRATVLWIAAVDDKCVAVAYSDGVMEMWDLERAKRVIEIATLPTGKMTWSSSRVALVRIYVYVYVYVYICMLT